MAIKIGNGEISTEILLLPKTEFLGILPQDFKRILLSGKSDEEIETILGDLWDASNPKQEDGGDTVIAESRKPKKSTAKTD